ncbi:MAG TPA: DUF167 family protein [Candidatus Paceibacterota bacterium]
MYIRVRVITGARTESFSKVSDDHYDLRVREKAERNMANRRVMQMIAEHFAIPVNKIRIVNGHHSPGKILSVDLES